MRPQSIKAKLVELGVTQQEIADKVDVTRQSVNKVIAGESKSARIQRAVARIIHVPVAQAFPNHKPERYHTHRRNSNNRCAA